MAKENKNFESALFNTADKLRKNIDAAEYKNVVLGLIFLKHISDSFSELYDKLNDDDFSDPEDRDEYLAENVFFVPQNARWAKLQAQAKLPEIGIAIDDAMSAIEKENRELKNVLPKVFAKPNLDKSSLGQLIDVISDIELKIEKHSFVLTPGRYVGIPDEEDDGIPFADKMNDLTATLAKQMIKEKELDDEIKVQLGKIGFEL